MDSPAQEQIQDNLTDNSSADQEDIPTFFKNIDSDFIGITKATDDIFRYSGIDVLIQNSWELPIIVQWPDANVSFKFSTTPSDIFFGIAFVAAPEEHERNLEPDIKIIEEISRIHSSDGEGIEGEFDLPCEGVVIFLWDNTFDWSSNKQLSYFIQVQEPSFQYIDEDRCLAVQPKLEEVLNALEITYIQKADTEDLIRRQKKGIAHKLKELEAMKQELQLKCRQMHELENEVCDSSEVIDANYEVILGICIRCLDRRLMSNIISYLDIFGGVNYVCVYWALIARDLRLNVIPAFDSQEEEEGSKYTSSKEQRRVLVDRLKRGEGSGSESTVGSSTVGGTVSSPADGVGVGVEGEGEDCGEPMVYDEYYTVADTRRRAVFIEDIFDKYFTFQPESEEEEDDGNEDDRVEGDEPHVLLSVSAAGAGALSPTVRRSANSRGMSVSFVDEPRSRTRSRSASSTEALALHQQPPSSSSSLSPTRRLKDTTTAAGDNEGPIDIQSPDRTSKEADKGASITNTNNVNSRDIKPPKVAEGKQSVASKPNSSSSKSRGASKGTASAEGEGEGADGMVNVKLIRSQQQMRAVIDVVSDGLDKLDALESEKRKLKMSIKSWNSVFEKENGRAPTKRERKALAGHLYDSYQKISLQLRVKGDKMEDLLKKIGLARPDFENLREKQLAHWKGVSSS